VATVLAGEATERARVDTSENVSVALDAAALMVMSGGPTTAANDLATSLLETFNASSPELAWRSDFILGTCEEAGEKRTFARPMAGVGVNLSRASALVELTQRAKAEQLAPAAVGHELKLIASLPSPYNRWVSILAAGVTAGAFSQIAVRNLGALAVVFVAAIVGQYFRSMLLARKVAGVTTTLIAGIVSASLAATGLKLGISKAVNPTLIASVMYMAPGLPLVNGFLDMASQKYLITGIERIANAALLFLAMAIAIGFAYVVVL